MPNGAPRNASQRNPRPALSAEVGCFKVTQEVIDMSRHERSNKESKKQPQHTAKEKKAAKQAKKHAGDHVPLIVKKP
jgi:hypothetical protein